MSVSIFVKLGVAEIELGMRKVKNGFKRKQSLSEQSYTHGDLKQATKFWSCFDNYACR